MKLLRYSENPSAPSATGPEKPATKETQPLMKPQAGPHASRRYTYSPPERGKLIPSSAYDKLPVRTMRAPTSQIARTSEGRPRSPARKPVVVKIPVPIILETT